MLAVQYAQVKFVAILLLNQIASYITHLHTLPNLGFKLPIINFEPQTTHEVISFNHTISSFIGLQYLIFAISDYLTTTKRGAKKVLEFY